MQVFVRATSLVAMMLFVLVLVPAHAIADGPDSGRSLERWQQPSPASAAPINQTMYIGACPAQPIQSYLWTGKTGQVPDGSHRCPAGMIPAVYGNPVAIRGGRRGQDDLDGNRAIMSAPQGWSGEWCSLAVTGVLPAKDKAHTVAVSCVWRDPENIAGLRKQFGDLKEGFEDFRNRPAPEPTIIAAPAKDGKPGEDGTKVSLLFGAGVDGFSELAFQGTLGLLFDSPDTWWGMIGASILRGQNEDPDFTWGFSPFARFGGYVSVKEVDFGLGVSLRYAVSAPEIERDWFNQRYGIGAAANIRFAETFMVDAEWNPLAWNIEARDEVDDFKRVSATEWWAVNVFWTPITF